MSFRTKAPRLTPDLAAAEAEAKSAPWASRVKELNQELIDARLYMLTRYPFWGRLAAKMEMMFTEEIDTACVRADYLTFFNPHFWQALPQKAKSFLIAHELCHLAYMHFDRLEERDSARWNRAGDYMINQMLVDSGMEMIADEHGKPYGLIDERFKGLSDVEVYDILEEEDRKANRDGYGRPKGQQGQGDGGQGEQPKGKGFGEMGGDCDFGATEELKERSDDGSGRRVPTPTEIRNDIVAAVAAAKQRGDCPAGMERWASELSEPKLSWEEFLKNYLDDRIRRNPTYAQLSRRTSSYNQMLRATGKGTRAASVPLPSKKPHLAPAVIAFDSSGSIGDDELAEMASETYAILQQYDGLPVRFMCADAAVHVDKMIETIDEIEFKGGGGTSHVPVFERLETSEEDGFEKPRVIICFTDLFTEFPQQAPECDVVWVNIGNHMPPEPPFGVLLHRNADLMNKRANFVSPVQQQRLLGGPMNESDRIQAMASAAAESDPVAALAYAQPGATIPPVTQGGATIPTRAQPARTR